MNDRPLGISTSLLSAVVAPDWPESTLLTLAHGPIRHIEYFCDEGTRRYEDDGHIARIKDAAAEGGITVWSVHAPFGATDISAEDEAARRGSIANAIRALDVAVALEAGVVVVHGSGEPITDEDRPTRLKQCVRSLNELCKRASQRGVRLAIETLPRTCLGNRTEEMGWLNRIVDGDLCVCYDVNHVTLYEDVRESLSYLGDRIGTLHISDHDGVDERHWIPGMGVIDWEGFLTGLDDIGYQGCLIHEARDPSINDLQGNLDRIIAAATEHLACPPQG